MSGHHRTQSYEYGVSIKAHRAGHAFNLRSASVESTLHLRKLFEAGALKLPPRVGPVGRFSIYVRDMCQYWGPELGIHDGSSRPLLILFVPSRSFACSRACSKTCDVLFVKVSNLTERRVTTSVDRSPISCKGLGQLIFEIFQIFPGRVTTCFKSILFFSQRHATICF